MRRRSAFDYLLIAMSIGDKVLSDGFEILRRYQRGTGERIQ
jgi:hypothetical protein